MKRLLFVTGQPGVGKTSVLLRVIDALKAKGYDVRGMITREIREQGTRVGFEIIDLYMGQKGWLAHVNQSSGPRIGKYRVNLDDLKNIGVNSILNAIKNADVIIIDEIGPMELFSQAFKDVILQAIDSTKPLIGTIHFKAQNALINAIKARNDVEILEVTNENRQSMHNIIIAKVLNTLSYDNSKHERTRKISNRKA
jgi:nucleoside-triphosphatase